MSMTNPWIIAGVTVIAVLSGYAIYLYWKLWRQQRANQSLSVKAKGSAVADVALRQLKERHTSIYVLARAIEDESLTLTEGCIRISAVASQLGDRQAFNREFSVLARVAEETAHIPILDAWRTLSKDEKRRFNKEREAIEARYREAVLETVARLKQTYKP